MIIINGKLLCCQATPHQAPWLGKAHQTDEEDSNSLGESPTSNGSSIWLWLSLALNATLVGVLAIGWFHEVSTECSSFSSTLSLTDMISYETVVFHSGPEYTSIRPNTKGHQTRSTLNGKPCITNSKRISTASIPSAYPSPIHLSHASRRRQSMCVDEVRNKVIGRSGSLDGTEKCSCFDKAQNDVARKEKYRLNCDTVRCSETARRTLQVQNTKKIHQTLLCEYDRLRYLPDVVGGRRVKDSWIGDGRAALTAICG
ncbi:hypothetical protein QBC32DRAFT_345778 [Pseudoneurospora amorphoporcata]|uniref:Uncharacterized protein n=1 Tax=Pseudoneurospora amorphoporcata TaxID=241081 RepID=A0AAN6NTC2_9PEZI|nr:hypothetical protein QBC32DRAFT_345778 [Pseudoneurospora amorphoporcata]